MDTGTRADPLQGGSQPDSYAHHGDSVGLALVLYGGSLQTLP